MASNDGRIEVRDWAMLGLLSLLWGGSFCFNGVVLKELPPMTVVFIRVVILQEVPSTIELAAIVSVSIGVFLASGAVSLRFSRRS